MSEKLEDRNLPEVEESLAATRFDVEYQVVPLSAMSPAAYNPREISDEALDGLESSLKTFGLVQPLVWNKRSGNLVGGHQRLKVLARHEIKETRVAVVDLDEVDEATLNITLNNPAIQGEFNIKMLADLTKMVKSKKSLAQWKALGLEALAKQMPLFDGVKETANADEKTKRQSTQEKTDEKLERADVRMLQLFFTTAQHKEVIGWIANSAEALGTDNASDTIFELLKGFNENLRASHEESKTEEKETASTAPAAVSA